MVSGDEANPPGGFTGMLASVQRDLRARESVGIPDALAVDLARSPGFSSTHGAVFPAQSDIPSHSNPGQ